MVHAANQRHRRVARKPDFCAAAFVKAARLVGATKPVRRITSKNVMLHGAQKAYERLQEVVRRVDAGETLAQIRAERQAAISEALRDGAADELAKPEPEDKTPDEWRYWKLRRLEPGLASNDAAAWAEFWRFFEAFKDTLTGGSYDFTEADASNARRILADLIIVWQRGQGG